MRNCKNLEWDMNINTSPEYSAAITAMVLMDIRDELQEANRELKWLRRIACCPNMLTIPGLLRRIDKRLTRKRKRIK